MKKYIKIICLLGMLFSCSTNKSLYQVYSIDDLLKTDKTIKLSELNADLLYIPLETTSESMIGTPDKIVYTDKAIYILSQQPNLIMEFAPNGQFIRQISCVGKSESEYTFANDFTVDEDNNRIYINDMGGELLVYDTDGNFIEKRRGTFTLKSILIDHNLYFESIQVIMGNEINKLVVRNMAGEMVSTHLNHVKYPNSSNTASYQDTKSLFNLNGEVVYHQMSSDTVYTYNSETKMLDVRYVFKNPKPLTSSDYEQFGDEGRKRTFVYDVAENNDYIFATFITPGWQKELRLIDKKSGIFLKADFTTTTEMNDSQNGITFLPKWQNGNTLIDCVQFDDDSNPVIVLLKNK